MNENSNEKPFVTAKIDRTFDGDGKIKAYATVVIADSFAVHGIKVMEGSKGNFVSMPSSSYQGKDGSTKYSEVCHPVSSDMRKMLDSAVLGAYNQTMAQSQSQALKAPENDVGVPFSLEDDSFIQTM